MAQRIEYTLEVIDSYMRPVFEGKEKDWTELMWDFLLPFPISCAALLEDIKSVESGDSDGWIFEGPGSKITCTQRGLVIEEKLTEEQDRKPIRIKISLREAKSLLERWLFECVWREQQRREQAEKARAQT
jgi:hypothetical protein